MQREEYEIHFAPLQGFTDSVFRNAFEKYFGGVSVYYTPFVRVEKGGFRNKDLRDVEPVRNVVGRLIPQILPGNPEETNLLVDMLVQKGYKDIDINLGCPFPLIAGKKKGAGMLPYPEKVREVLSPLKSYPDIRFSVKMRLGWENTDECLRLLEVLNDISLSHITVHARTGKQQYKGLTYPEAFGDFYKECRHPLFYNGDLRTLTDIDRILENFPRIKGVAIGRGLLASPFLAKGFYGNLAFTENEQMSLLAGFHEELFRGYSQVLQGENQLLVRMKSLWEYFLPDTDRKLLKKIRKAGKLGQYIEATKAIFTIE